MPGVLFENLSSRTVVACLFQTWAQAPSGASVIAWRTRSVAVNGFWRRTWTQDYQLAWVQTSESSQTGAYLSADPQGNNTATLTYASQTFALGDLRVDEPRDALRIVQGATVPPRRGLAGIGMGRSAALLVPTQPNVNLDFAPPVRYWFTIGDRYETGQALDPSLAIPKQELGFGADDELYLSLLPNNTLSNPLPSSLSPIALRRFSATDGTVEV